MSKGFAGTLVLGRAPPAEPLVKIELLLTMPFLSQFSKKCHGVLKENIPWARAACAGWCEGNYSPSPPALSLLNFCPPRRQQQSPSPLQAAGTPARPRSPPPLAETWLLAASSAAPLPRAPSPSSSPGSEAMQLQGCFLTARNFDLGRVHGALPACPASISCFLLRLLMCTRRV